MSVGESETGRKKERDSELFFFRGILFSPIKGRPLIKTVINKLIDNR